MMQQSQKNILELTSVRFFATFAVFLMHIQEFLNIPPMLRQLIATGGIGVTFFFVLSGFILTYNYSERFASDFNLKQYKNFLLARIFRIYPAYLLALILSALWLCWLSNINPNGVRWPNNAMGSFLITLAGLQTYAGDTVTQQFWNAPSWSISTELSFYLTFPFIFLAIMRHFFERFQLVFLLVFCIVMAILCKFIAINLAYSGYLDISLWLDYIADRNFFWRVWEFIFGVIICILYQDGFFSFLKNTIWRHSVLIFAIVFIIYIALLPWPDPGMASMTQRHMRLGTINFIPFASIILCLASGPTILSPWLQSKLMVLLGESSYALYIYHWIPVSILFALRGGGYGVSRVQLLGVLLATILFSILSFLVFESPVRRYLSGRFLDAHPRRNLAKEGVQEDAFFGFRSTPSSARAPWL